MSKIPAKVPCRIHCYRVWMKDGYAGLYNSETEADARTQAIERATYDTKNCAMDARDRKLATTVDYVDCLSK